METTFFYKPQPKPEILYVRGHDGQQLCSGVQWWYGLFDFKNRKIQTQVLRNN